MLLSSNKYAKTVYAVARHNCLGYFIYLNERSFHSGEIFANFKSIVNGRNNVLFWVILIPAKSPNGFRYHGLY